MGENGKNERSGMRFMVRGAAIVQLGYGVRVSGSMDQYPVSNSGPHLILSSYSAGLLKPVKGSMDRTSSSADRADGDEIPTNGPADIVGWLIIPD